MPTPLDDDDESTFIKTQSQQARCLTIKTTYAHESKKQEYGKSNFFNFNARMGIVTILHDSFVCLYASSTIMFVELACVNRKEKQVRAPECLCLSE